MKRFLVAVAFGLMAIAAQAEASFDQIQTLIQQQNYSAAEKGLEEIIRNHPKSAKAFYAMAQAQAGLGNQDKARKALDIATGLNPTLDFAPASSVQSLRDAITPQVSKIEAIEESHTMRNAMILLLLGVVGFAIWYARAEMKRKEQEEAELAEKLAAQAERHARQREEARQAREALDKAEAEREAELARQLREQQAAEEALKAHKNYGHERFDPANPDKLKSVKQFKEEKLAEEMLVKARAEANEAKLRAEAAEARGRNYHTPAQTVAQPAPTVVHTNSSSTDLLTGVMIGSMMNSHHHDTERTVVRETVREVPVPSRDSSWDDTPSTPSRSSSWDDTPSRSASSSSWDSGSSSSSSSSWDSGSSSSDSSSSSSWD